MQALLDQVCRRDGALAVCTNKPQRQAQRLLAWDGSGPVPELQPGGTPVVREGWLPRSRGANDEMLDAAMAELIAHRPQAAIVFDQSLLFSVKYYFQQPPVVVAPPPEPTPEVVPVEPPKDDDQDGVFNDIDKCPDSPAGSVVDETGCPPPPPPPPPKTCKTPGPGEKISLAGCGTGDNIVLRGVNFDTNKATLTRNAKVLLDDVAAELNQYQDIKVQVGGHTDSRGSAALNDGLSKRRAASVMAYLTAKGIAANRMTSAGFGPNEPIADNATAEGRSQNRRVEIILRPVT